MNSLKSTLSRRRVGRCILRWVFGISFSGAFSYFTVLRILPVSVLSICVRRFGVLRDNGLVEPVFEHMLVG